MTPSISNDLSNALSFIVDVFLFPLAAFVLLFSFDRAERDGVFEPRGFFGRADCTGFFATDGSFAVAFSRSLTTNTSEL